MEVKPSEDGFSALLDAAVDAVILIDCDGHITRFNRAAETMFGYAASEVLGQNVSRLMPAPYRAEHDHFLRRYLETGERHIIGIGREAVARHKSGATFPIDLSVGEFRSGENRGFVGVLRNISQRKRQEAELRERTEELRMIFTSTPSPLAIADTDGVVIDVNHACEALLGYTLRELVGCRHSDLLVEEDREGAEAAFRKLLESGGDMRRELRYRSADGRIVPAGLYAGLARGSDGAPRLFIIEIADRSALYALSGEAEELKSRLAHVNRLGTLGEMVSGIAHEVNQPLTAIANYARAVKRLLAGGQAQPGEIAEVLEKIGAQAERAGQIIRGLRSMVRNQQNKRERLDCNALIDEVVRLLDFEQRTWGIRLKLELAPGLPPVNGNGVQIQQVVLNLVRNAMEAMKDDKPGGTVCVASASPVPGKVEISVVDSGPGVPPAVEEHLFEPFYTTKPQGMGLGLSICRSIAAAHGGDLRYRPNLPTGAQFVMQLPAAAE